MKDIVDALEGVADLDHGLEHLLQAAADEIKRLRVHNDSLRAACNGYLKALRK